MINVIICGVRGKMGKALLDQCMADDDITVVGAVERPGHSDVGLSIWQGLRITDEFEKCIAKEEDANVIIDFTHPASSVCHAEAATFYNKAIVIGTTGFTEKQMGRIRACALATRIVLSPNFSVGVNVLFKVLADVAKITGDDYDVEIVEAHHIQKEDIPSGTAKKMAEVIAEGLNRDPSNIMCPRTMGRYRDGEIGISSIRGGDIFGEHTVMFCGQGERLEFIHRAGSRDNFARGAIRAAKWVTVPNKPPGLYDMQDVLELR